MAESGPKGSLGHRPMVGRPALTRSIGVQIPVPQPRVSSIYPLIYDIPTGLESTTRRPPQGDGETHPQTPDKVSDTMGVARSKLLPQQDVAQTGC